MTLKRRTVLQGASVATLTAGLPGGASAQTRAETLRYVTGNTVNTLDTTMPGATREAFGVSMNVYDRLFSFGRKRSGDNWTFDPSVIRGELAKSYTISPDGKLITIALRDNATWHDGSPVTAEDVKWSLDRAVSAKSLAPPQLSTGSLTAVEQFKVVDPMTVTVTLDKPDRLALANLCVCYVIMINSKLARQHATPEDPWAMEWMKTNTAASGAYVVESHKPGESTVLRRNEKWTGGTDGLPFFRRVIIQTVPEPGTRANLLERGDADLSIDLAASDMQTMEKSAKAKVASIPQNNGFTHITMNNAMAPVRQPEGPPGGGGGAALRGHVQGVDLRPRQQAVQRHLVRHPRQHRLPAGDAEQDGPGVWPRSCWPRPGCRTASRPPSPSRSASPPPRSRWRRW